MPTILLPIHFCEQCKNKFQLFYETFLSHFANEKETSIVHNGKWNKKNWDMQIYTNGKQLEKNRRV